MAIKIPIFADYNDRGVKDAEDSFGKLGDKIGKIAQTAALAFAAIGAAAAVGAFKAIEKASDLAESLSKIDVIFGDAGESVKAFSKTAAKELGLSEQAVLDAAGTFGIFGKAAGLGGTDLSDFTTKFTTLAADLASFNNTTPEDAILAIGSALRGESEPLRKYGVLLDDASLKAAAMELGIYDGVGALTSQQKTLAASEVIFKQTNDAQGDFARTSDGLANQQRIFKATLDNVVTTIGTHLLPVFLAFTSFVSDKIMPAVESLTKAFEKDGLAGVLELVKKQLPAIQEFLGNAVSTFANWLKESYPPALEALLDLFYNLGQWLLNTGLPALADLLTKAGNALFDWIEKAAPPALKRLGQLLGDLANWILDTGLPLLVEKLTKLGNALVDWIKPAIAPALKELGKLLLSLLEWILTVGVPKLSEQALKLVVALTGWVAKLLPEILKGLGTLVVDLVKKIPSIFKWLVTSMANLGQDLGEGLIDALIKALKGLASMGLDIGKSFANAIIRFINTNVIDKINNLLEFKVGPVTIDPPDIPNIPQLGDGGIVSRPTLAVIGEKGPEAVIPLSKGMGMGGGNNYYTINTGADPQAVVRALQQYNRTIGAVPLNTRAF